MLAEFFTSPTGQWILAILTPGLLFGLIWYFFGDGRGDGPPPKPRDAKDRSPGGYYRKDYSDFGNLCHGDAGDPSG